MSKVDVTTPSDREIKVTRVFDAPAARIFDCHTKPEYVQRWLLGPPGWSMPVCEIDLKVGGRFRYLWRDDANGTEFAVEGEFREISPPNCLVHTERMDGFDGEMVETLTMVEKDGRTTLVAAMMFPSKESRDKALQSGMADGMAASYDRLETQISEKVE